MMTQNTTGSLDRAAWQLIEAFSKYEGPSSGRLFILLQQTRLLVKARWVTDHAVKVVHG